MNRGEFANQLNRAWYILRLLKLAEFRNAHPAYAKIGAATFRNTPYIDVWRRCFADDYFDFQLKDNSLLQFKLNSIDPLDVNYAFLECPYSVLPYLEFLLENDYDPKLEGDSRREEYEAYIQDCPTKDDVTPVRYDFDIPNYLEGLHPVSHIHFGHESNLRVSTKKVLKPISFVLFVLRQFYPHSWSSLLKRKDVNIICRHVKTSLDAVPAIHYGPGDDYEMHLI